MHGRLKVKTTAEQQEAKRKERERKLLLYRAATDKIFSKRKNNELDQEMLNLTGELLSTNPDFSTLWNIRRELFEAWLTTKATEELQKAFTSELYFLEQCLSTNPKSYGTWHQRCWVLNRMPEPNWKRELMLCSRFLELDERNFHCWDYRRFVVKRFGVSAETELEFTTTKISSNFSNFSSWHYRSKLLPIVHPDSSQPTGVKTDILQQEFELVQNAFFTDPSDQSAWFYHKWLLGKEQKELSIQSAFLDEQMSKIFVTLTRPAQYGKDFDLMLMINDEKMDAKWSSVGGKYSVLWIAQLNEEAMSRDKTELSIKLTLSGLPEKMLLAEIYLGDHRYYKNWGRETFSLATSFFLGQEIDLCKQLHDLEPDNKWVILTLLSLMRALEPERFRGETMSYLEKLVVLDPMRRNYYSDLRSRFIWEDNLQFCANDVRSFSLTDQQLTAVYHLEQLVRMTSVDLSKNCLSQLRNGHLLQCVKELKLNNNCLTTCNGINNLPCLQVLDLRNNDIKDAGALLALQSCPRLETILLSGNPVMNLPDSLDKIAQVLPTVNLSDCPDANVNGEL